MHKIEERGLDLALEASRLLRGDSGREIAGVEERVRHYPHANVTAIRILNETGEQTMKKPRGRYITVEAPEARDKAFWPEISVIVAEELRRLLPADKADKAPLLLLGLGNSLATPDALGPAVVQKSRVTRHIYEYAPQLADEGVRSLAAISPGVLGSTGIETIEIVRGIVAHIRPACILAVDSLAASDLSRIGNTFQMTDTGIDPGSGIGNKRAPINRETLGVPVVAIGVPTVVHAAVIIRQTLAQLKQRWSGELMMADWQKKLDKGTELDIRAELLRPFGGELIVTPKEIDEIIEGVAEIIAAAVAQAVHPSVNSENYPLFLQ